jgi:hypothetical protein
METIDPILTKITRFINKTGMAPTTFGKEAAGDVNLVSQLQAGRELRRKLRARVLSYIEDYNK